MYCIGMLMKSFGTQLAFHLFDVAALLLKNCKSSDVSLLI